MEIKNVIRLAVMTAVTTGLLGCATTKNYSTAINSWVGAPKQALVHEWGSPTSVKTLHNGYHVYTYRVAEKIKFMRTYEPVVPTGRLSPQSRNNMLSHAPTTIQQHDQTFWCVTHFTLNRDNMIVHTGFEGNNCMITKPRAQQWTFTN